MHFCTVVVDLSGIVAGALPGGRSTTVGGYGARYSARTLGAYEWWTVKPIRSYNATADVLRSSTCR